MPKKYRKTVKCYPHIAKSTFSQTQGMEGAQEEEQREEMSMPWRVDGAAKESHCLIHEHD